jgi:prepilin-type N-terminal cleavage/methylation domain-containing protein
MQRAQILLEFMERNNMRKNETRNFFEQKFAVNSQQRGFSLVELSIVLVVIGIIIGAVAIARDVQRNAIYQKISSDFIQGWSNAYDRFYANTGRPPGDNALAPTGIVNGVTATPLCAAALQNALLAAGVDLPTGRTEGSADRYVYLDSNGNPQEIRVCFTNVAWSEAGATVGTYVTRNRNVMTLENITPSLASLLDNSLDGIVDARFGRMREQSQSNNVVANHTGVAWSSDDTVAIGGGAAGRDEAQVIVLNGYLKMSR